jgi:hypothetical protein
VAIAGVSAATDVIVTGPLTVACAGGEATLVPPALTATTEIIYETPALSPVTVIGLVVPDVFIVVPPPTGVAETIYVIPLPPDDEGAKETVTCPLPDVIVRPPAPGGAGGATGMTPAEKADGGLVPAELVAVTENIYAIPFVNPVTVIGLFVPVAVIFGPPPVGVAVTVYEMIALPPVEAGGENVTVA